MKELTVREVAAVKRVFKNSLPALKKIETIDRKIAELQAEREIQESIINAGEAGIMKMTGGYRSVDIIKCEYVPQFNEDGSPKMDAEGKYQQKKQVLTLVPPVEAEPVAPEAVEAVETSASTEEFNGFAQAENLDEE